MLKIDNATFHYSTHAEDFEPEMVGDAEWTFNWREVKRVCKKLPKFADSSVCGDLEYLLDDCETDHDPEDLADATLTITDADLAIAIVCAMIHLGGEWEVHYTGHGSEYWFWHDMWHAENDFGICSEGMCSVDIGSSDEAQAMIGGAKAAREHGVSVADIARQLVNAEKLWQERFGHEEYFLEKFLD